MGCYARPVPPTRGLAQPTAHQCERIATRKTRRRARRTPCFIVGKQPRCAMTASWASSIPVRGACARAAAISRCLHSHCRRSSSLAFCAAREVPLQELWSTACFADMRCGLQRVQVLRGQHIDHRSRGANPHRDPHGRLRCHGGGRGNPFLRHRQVEAKTRGLALFSARFSLIRLHRQWLEEVARRAGGLLESIRVEIEKQREPARQQFAVTMRTLAQSSFSALTGAPAESLAAFVRRAKSTCRLLALRRSLPAGGLAQKP